MLDQLIQLDVVVAPGRFEEPCFHLGQGDRLEYRFDAGAALEFNLHYHAEEVFYPRQEAAARTGEGSYTAPQAREYCLMWINHHGDPVKLDYEFKIFTPGETP